MTGQVLPFRTRQKPTLKEAIAKLGGACILATLAVNHGTTDEAREAKRRLFDRAFAVVMLLLDEMQTVDAEEARL